LDPCCARCYAARTKQAAIIETVFAAWSVPKVCKRHGKSLGAVVSSTEPREWKYNRVRELGQLERATEL
jgi:hypothetical protein